jgi:hypothetical protein
LVGVGSLVGLRVRVGPGVLVGRRGVLLGASVGGTSVSVGCRGAIVSLVLGTTSSGVIEGIPSGVGVFVLVGARVGSGAWVGVATSVVPGSSIVDGGTSVGVGVVIVGRRSGTTVVTTSGLVKRRGRIHKLSIPNP